MIAAAMFLTPAVAEAAVYKWKVNGGGDWTVPANWEPIEELVHVIAAPGNLEYVRSGLLLSAEAFLQDLAKERPIEGVPPSITRA
jgi:hypothetical protein